MEELIQEFLSVDFGDGSGSGSGSGDGFGSGYGFGYGFGDGSGDGSGSGCGFGFGDGSGSGGGFGDGSGDEYGSGCGSGCGFGDGSGIKAFNGQTVHVIDNTQTILTNVRGNIASGFILGADLQLMPTYIARVGNNFAHGKTIQEALADAQAKHDVNLPLKDRVTEFLKRYPADSFHSGRDLFEGHRLLTGSCRQGREQFVRDNGIDLDTMFTLDEFVSITKSAYGSEAVKALADALGEKQK